VQLHNINGIEGEVSLIGYKAVAAMFQRWSLERRRDKGSETPSWTLRAVLSFQKDSLLARDGVQKRITVKLNGGVWELRPLEGVKYVVDEGRLVVDGVTLWRPEDQQ
jgi:hypothetical protein